MSEMPRDSELSSTEDESEVESGQGGDEEWEDWEEEGGATGSDDGEEEEPTISLFGPEVLPSVVAAIQHDASTHGFDLRHFAAQLRLDDYGIIRTINYIRSEVAARRDPLPSLASAAAASASTAGSSSAPWLQDDAYLRPVLQEDPLLFYEYDEAVAALNASAGAAVVPVPQHAGGSDSHEGAVASASATAASISSSAGEVARLAAENVALRAALQQLREAFMPDELKDAVADDGNAASAGPSTSSNGHRPGSGPSTSESALPASASTEVSNGTAGTRSAAATAGKSRSVLQVDEAYFDSYSGFDIHKEMLSDKPRTEAYQRALEGNPSLLKGATVMDVGCGTGILSLFAARGGAAKVVALDASTRIAGYARQIAAANNLSAETGGPVSVVVGQLEELTAEQLGVQQVDVIVSEWMGYGLLFESMLDTVLLARDRFLKPGGAILPDIATVFVAGAAPSSLGLDFWSDVYGFRMTPIADTMKEASLGKGCVLSVQQNELLTDAVAIKELDLCTMKPGDQDFTANFTLSASASLTTPTPLATLVLWFDTAFSPRHCTEAPVVLSTSPACPVTHWAQTVVALRTPVLLLAAGGASAAGGPPTASELTGRISMVHAIGKHRSLDISVEYIAVLTDGSKAADSLLVHMGMLADN